jgi:hypothetical protein
MTETKGGQGLGQKMEPGRERFEGDDIDDLTSPHWSVRLYHESIRKEFADSRSVLDTDQAYAWDTPGASLPRAHSLFELRGARAAPPPAYSASDWSNHIELSGAHRGRGPKGYTRPDERIWEEVCDRLTDDPLLDASDMEVKVSKSRS